MCGWVYLDPHCNGIKGRELRRVRDSSLGSCSYFMTVGKSFNLYALLIPHVENADGAPFFTCCCLAQIRAELE